MEFYQLPVEIIKAILRQVYLQPFHDICQRFPNHPFTRVLESILYEEIYYGPPYLNLKDTQVSIEELYRLAMGEIKASVQRLKISTDPNVGIGFDFLDFLRFAENYPVFLEAIPRIDFKGSIKHLRIYGSRVSLQNVHGWNVDGDEKFDVEFVPPNLEEVDISHGQSLLTAIDWPKSLTTMKIQG